MATVAQQLQHVREALSPISGEMAALEARLLAQHAWGVKHEEILRDWDKPITDDAAQQLQHITHRRAQREPMSQILGEKDFWKDTFLVSSAVLTPRADSETLIEALLRHRPDMAAPLRMLDLGTGSGCLLQSALREYPNAQGVGVDLSPAALSVAKQNALRLGLQGRLQFLEGSWCNPLDSADRFDIVISNPPYIAHADIAALDEDVKGYEPHLALDGGVDGLDCYRTIFNSLGGHLNPGALVLVEVGAGQADDVAVLGTGAGLRHLETCQDLAGIARIVCFG